MQEPQLFEVGLTLTVPVVAGGVTTGGGLFVAGGLFVTGGVVWQREQAIIAALTPVWVVVLGALPVTHVPQLTEVANALLAKNAGNANAVAKTRVLILSFMLPPKS